MSSIFGILGNALLNSKIRDYTDNQAYSNKLTPDNIRLNTRTKKAEQAVRLITADLAKAMLINEALWEIIRDNLKLSDEDLLKKIHEVDMRDGRLDNKNQRKATQCPSCNHMVSARHPACIYCGKVIDKSVFNIRNY